MICCPYRYGSSLTQLSTLLGSDVGVLGHLCGVKMLQLCHGWGWQQPQTASHIHIRHIQSCHGWGWQPLQTASSIQNRHTRRCHWWDESVLVSSAMSVPGPEGCIEMFWYPLVGNWSIMKKVLLRKSVSLLYFIMSSVIIFPIFDKLPNFGEMNPRTYGLPITKFASTLCCKPTYIW